jgi:hypothetical protein
MPDDVAIYPLYPRRKQEGGEIDHDWCRTQYQTGMLQRKSRRRSTKLLTALRGSLEAHRLLPGPPSPKTT